MKIRNVLSVDVEDYFCAYNLNHTIKKEEWDTLELTVVRNTRKLLKLFDTCSVEATFFILGWIAQRVPELIAEIDQHGHEIASHGYSHRLLTEMSPQEFKEDIHCALETTQRYVKQKIVGYRAPSFTITKKTLWAYDVLSQFGITYDSSVFPVKFHPEYGIPGAPTTIYRTESGIIEVPISCVSIMGMRIPCTGGAYFRIFPYWFSRFLFRRCNSLGNPVVFYLHPWEIDPDQPRFPLPLLRRFRHYYNLRSTERRLEKMLTQFQFSSMRSVLRGSD
jgi:polysaccharide deacetylase family protein (PEP-CTERM system associated)